MPRFCLAVPAAVVATGPDDAVLKELATLLLQVPEVGMRVEDVVDATVTEPRRRSDASGQQHQSSLKTRTLNEELQCKIQRQTQKTLMSARGTLDSDPARG